MRSIAIALLAVSVVGCSGNSPTSPSVFGTASSVSTTRVDAESASVRLQKVTVHLYSDDIEIAGYSHIVGLPVTVTGLPSGTVVTDETNKQGAAIVEIPASDGSIQVTTNDWGDFCGIPPVNLELPLRTRDGWLLVHQACP